MIEEAHTILTKSGKINKPERGGARENFATVTTMLLRAKYKRKDAASDTVLEERALLTGELVPSLAI